MTNVFKDLQTKNFDNYLAKRLTKKEIKEIEQQAKLELEALHQAEKHK